ncbi:MAG: exosortase system-associated protein, TIGR04073 family [Candidatus Omnitrophica bacterium]|nr:exosortase system-associated protein, TIGR04073 family [Candidatus Omnitrophota bacterium]
MKRISKLIVCVIIISFCLTNISYAGAFKKLGRGLANTFTGWIEVFTTIERKFEEEEYLIAVFYGFPEGLVRAVTRTAVGLYETVTFPIPIPDNYEVILEPEFVLERPYEKVRPE